MCPEWAQDFWSFVETVGLRPDGYTLRRKSVSQPLGPDNWWWKKSTPSKDKALYSRTWRQNNKRSTKSAELKKIYGLSMDDYEELERQQGHVCAICGKPPEGRYKNLSVDHCHTTGEIRGLLCSTCNMALGFFGDGPVLVRRALEYLLRDRC